MVSITTLTATTIFSLFFFTYPSLYNSSNLKISVTPKTIHKSGDSVTIRWTGFDSPSRLDWLGIYSPPNSAHKDFIGYFFISSSPESQSGSGSGSFTFPLINLRSGYQFRIFHWPDSEVNKHQDHDRNQLPVTKHLLVESEVVGFEPGQGPEQVHLALTGRSGEMRVMFVTHDGRESFVKYGLTPEGLDRVGNSKVSRYGREDMCHAPANLSVGWRDPGYIHDAVMVDLKNGTKYYYKVGSDSGGWSMPYSFVSHNEDSSEAVAFLFGDMGTATPYKTFIRTQDESISTIKWITRDMEALGDKPVFISHIGDISYARGYAWIWDNFFNQIEPIASKAPYHVCIGNHEYNWVAQPWRPDWAVQIFGKDGGGECGVPYSFRFNMPGDSSEPTGSHSPSTRNLYYSVDVGPVHFVYMSTETNFLTGSKQYEFLKHDLESVDRQKTPFVVVQGHRPMYTTSSGDRDAPHTQRMREHLEPLFVKNKVSLALWAHVHRYERFCPINNNKCGNLDIDGGTGEAFPVHIVIGMGGQDWQATWQPRKEHPDLPIYPQPSQSLFRGGIFGYTRLEASKEKLIFSYIGNHDGEVHDKVEIHASGLVISGGSSNTDRNADPNPKCNADSPEAKEGGKVESNLSLYITSVIVLLVGTLIGYIIGFKSHASHDATPGWRWTRVGNEEL